MRAHAAALLLVLLAGCFDCEGTAAAWHDEDAPAVLRAVLGDPVPLPYRGDVGFGAYRIADAYLQTIGWANSTYNMALAVDGIRYWVMADEAIDAIRAGLQNLTTEAYRGDAQTAIEASLAEFRGFVDELDDDERSYYMIGGHVELDAGWDLDALWGERNDTLAPTTFGFGESVGEWTFRYRVGEWRLDLDGLDVKYDIFGRAEADHGQNLEQEDIQARIGAWFEAHGATARFDGFDVSYVMC